MELLEVADRRVGGERRAVEQFADVEVHAYSSSITSA